MIKATLACSKTGEHSRAISGVPWTRRGAGRLASLPEDTAWPGGSISWCRGVWWWWEDREARLQILEGLCPRFSGVVHPTGGSLVDIQYVVLPRGSLQAEVKRAHETGDVLQDKKHPKLSRDTTEVGAV